MKLQIQVNGCAVSSDVDPRTLLVDFLREDAGLTGTHVGCETTQCGACTVHLNGRAIKSCTMLAVEAEGAEIETIEGVAPSSTELHVMQHAFRTHHGLQCGYCTSGMVMMGLDIVRRHRDAGTMPTDEDIRHDLKGNICRCTGYANIVTAIRAGATAMLDSEVGQ